MKRYATVLSIAGSDSGGGAGIQADLKTISALGCYATTAITALTAQNTIGVSEIFPLPVAFVEKQIIAVMSDIGADAVKIGMLFSSEIMLSLKKLILKYNMKNVVLDPVMVASSGDRLIESQGIETLKELIPLSGIITPNLEEAKILLNKKEIHKSGMEYAALELLKFGSQAVFLKGGHLYEEELIDVYVDQEGNEMILESKKIESRNIHGTGCTLSSAIASFLALGMSMKEASLEAQHFINQAIKKGKKIRVGEGKGPVNHFFMPRKMQIISEKNQSKRV